MKVINNNVIHFEDEKLVGLVLTHDQAAIIAWYIGASLAFSPTQGVWDGLEQIEQVNEGRHAIAEEYSSSRTYMKTKHDPPSFKMLEDK